eukprot:TRINITY_DN13708_c0_g1_i2.p1 TRINITY_DN13708_c0_g1~~TRINITY_DN13708_c0_g1_i2.p1  ORF type:complete len:1288 (+),score=417.73 TRINITY_DN13708_c0_g1_i2:86-3865(+)
MDANLTVDMLEDARDIFGDGTMEDLEAMDAELGTVQVPEEEVEDEKDMTPAAIALAKQRKKLARIREMYEPAMLQSLYLEESDEIVKTTDIPERLQYAYHRYPKMSKELEIEDIASEKFWMYHRIIPKEDQEMFSEEEKTSRIEAIARVLKYLRLQYLEIAFIIEHRKDYYHPLSEPDLWDIFKYDQEWRNLMNRARALLASVNLIELPQAKEFATLLDSAIEPDVEIQSHHRTLLEETVGDLAAYFAVLVGEEVKISSRKLPVRRYSLPTYEMTGRMDYVRLLGISPAELAANLELGYASHRSEDPDKTVEEAAKEHLTFTTKDPELVRRFGRRIAAQLIATHPGVRRYVRKLYRETATLTTTLTNKGMREINPFSTAAAVGSLKNKPVMYMFDFQDRQQFLHIEKGIVDGLMTCEIGLSEDHKGKILQELEDMYLTLDTSEQAQGWNEERRGILRNVLDDHLIPLFTKEMRAMLLRDAAEHVAEGIGADLSAKLMMAPYTPANVDMIDDDDDFEMSNKPRVVSVLLNPQRITVMCALDANGEVIDHLHLKFLRNSERNPTQAKQKRDDVASLKAFIRQTRPQLIAVAPTDMMARYLKQDIETWMGELDKTGTKYKIVYAPQEHAVPYHVSDRARNEFPHYNDEMRKVISIGRRQQDPIAEIAGLCNPTDDIMNMHFHPLQHVIPKEILKYNIERAFVSVVNKVGIDLISARQHPHLAHALQFVAGLGPRKAAALQQALRRMGSRVSRRDFLVQKELVGKVVYTNCAATLYFDGGGLDGTRIHPENYAHAVQIAVDALEIENPVDSKMSQYIEQIMHNPAKMDLLDLDSFADRLEETSHGKHRETLFTIRRELTEPYGEIRTPYKEMPPAEVFQLLTGETEETLCRGALVAATVTRVNENSVKVRLESGVTGWIGIADISDAHINSAADRCKVNQVIRCRVKQCAPENFFNDTRDQPFLTLSSKSSDLKNNEYFEGELHREMYWQKDKPAEDARAKQASFVPRPITHPAFANCTRAECEEKLLSGEYGNAMFRPSSKGVKYLTLTWRFTGPADEPIFRHDLIEEDNKPTNNIAGLGATLKLAGEEYEDLDEILTRYVEACTELVRELTQQKYYRNEALDDVKEMLVAEKRATPNRIPYFVCPAPGKPGFFLLCFQPNESSTKKEYVGITPDGYRYRNQMFKSPSRLIAYFKKNALSRPSASSASVTRPRGPPSAPSGQHGHRGPVQGRRDDYRGAGGWGASQHPDQRGYQAQATGSRY